MRWFVEQDNFGETRAGFITTFKLSVSGGCAPDAAKYFLPAAVDIDPDTLELKSKGNFITAYIELPVGYDVSVISVPSLQLNYSIYALTSPASIGDYDKDGIKDLMVKFDRGKAAGLLKLGDNELLVSGNLIDGTRFEGIYMIKAI